MNYLNQLAQDVTNAVQQKNSIAVFYASKRLSEELSRLDPRDFTPESRADFARIRSNVIRMGTDLRDINYEVVWERIGPAFPSIIAGYAGEGSRGDHNFKKQQASSIQSVMGVPPELSNSLPLFRNDHKDPSRTAFIMMQFGNTRVHEEIVTSIRTTLASFGLEGLRADDKEYHDDLFPNVLTYIHGCAFGIAVFERLESDSFNPNVALEVGYMRALRKPLCLLKDQTQRTLPTDLVGKLYKDFDPQNVSTTIPPQIEKWLTDRDMVKA